MSQPNPERRSTGAVICFCAGVFMGGAAWLLGVGAVIGAALSGGNPAIVVGSVFAAVALSLLATLSFVLMLIGGIWMFIQVVADQSGNAEEQRYRDVER